VSTPPRHPDSHGTGCHGGLVESLPEQAGSPAGLANALDDPSWDGELRAEADEVLALTGKGRRKGPACARDR
jgi:hypothetical protein